MGREIKRVPLDFDWPRNEVWKGFLNPYNNHCRDCEACDHSGYSPEAKQLHDQWYGYVPFRPSSTGSKPFTVRHPIIYARAKNAIERNPEFFGDGEENILQEARRLAKLFNERWSHHIDDADVAALIKADRLWDFTRTPRTPEQEEIVRQKVASGENSWLPKGNGYIPSAAEVNEWSLFGISHDSINCGVIIEAKCKRLKVPYKCHVCKGHGIIWNSMRSKRLAENWKRQEPPKGEGWQFWETVTEGSPQSPVFANRDALESWLVIHEGYSLEAAQNLTEAGWEPSGMFMTAAVNQHTSLTVALPVVPVKEICD